MNFDLTRVRQGLLLYAASVDTLLATYDRIEVLRALTKDDTYVALTDYAASKASITGSNRGPFQISGTSLSLTLEDGSTLEHVFTGTNPIDAVDAAEQLNVASALLDCTTEDDYLVLRTASTGTGAAIRVEGGDACWWLGFQRMDTGFGKDAHPTLASGQVIYPFVDQNGSTDYSYRYRFVKQTPPAVSIMYGPTAIGADIAVDLDKLAVGTIHVVELDGQAAAGRDVHVSNRYAPSSIDQRLVITDQIKKLDASGNAAFNLIRGSKIEFYVPGSPLHRTITVPDLAEFDMLDPSLVADDELGIVVTPYTSLPRTTLP